MRASPLFNPPRTNPGHRRTDLQCFRRFNILAADSVDNTKLANQAQATVKGRAAGTGTGDPVDLSADQVVGVLNTATTDLAASLLPATVDANARIVVEKNGTAIGTRRSINFIEGSNVTLTVADDSSNEEVDVTISSTASGGGGVSLGLALALG